MLRFLQIVLLHAAGAVAVVRQHRRFAVMAVDRQREIVRDVPLGVEAVILKLVLLRARLLLEAGVLHAGNGLVQIGRGGDRLVAVEGDDIERAVKPVRFIRALLVLQRTRKQRVGGDGQCVGRLELDDRLAVQTLIFVVRKVVAAVIGDRDQLVRVGRRVVDLGRCVDEAVAGVEEISERADIPRVGGRRHGRKMPFLIAAEQRHAEGLVGVRPARQPGDFRRDFRAAIDTVIGAGVVVELAAERAVKARLARIEGTPRHDVDRRTDTARGDGGAAGLVDFQRLHAFRRQVGEVERARHANGAVGAFVAADRLDIRRRQGATVKRDEIEARPEAAHGDLRALTVDAVDRHAGDALQRFREVGVGELADIFRRNGVDDTGRIALDRDRPLKAGADAGDDDIVARRRVGRLAGVLWSRRALRMGGLREREPRGERYYRSRPDISRRVTKALH